MPNHIRRSLLLSSWSLVFLPALADAAIGEQQGGQGPASSAKPVGDAFPSQDPQLVKEMVTVAHGNVARVKELVGRQQTLAKANYDWGFGDWESAIGAASHVGSREIAEFLLANGARPTMFSAAMLGHLDVVKAMLAASPGSQKIKGPHTITLLRHAMAGGVQAKPVVDYLTQLGGADDRLPTKPITSEENAKLAGVYVGARPIGSKSRSFGTSCKSVGQVTCRAVSRTWGRSSSIPPAPKTFVSGSPKRAAASR